MWWGRGRIGVVYAEQFCKGRPISWRGVSGMVIDTQFIDLHCGQKRIAVVMIPFQYFMFLLLHSLPLPTTSLLLVYLYRFRHIACSPSRPVTLSILQRSKRLIISVL